MKSYTDFLVFLKLWIDSTRFREKQIEVHEEGCIALELNRTQVGFWTLAMRVEPGDTKIGSDTSVVNFLFNECMF